MKQTKILILSLLLASLLTGCYSHRVVGLLQDRKDLPHYEEVPYEPYRIRVNDEILYRLITMDETISQLLSQGSGANEMNYANSYRVYSDGTIDIPFLDPVPVVGLTIDSAEKVLQERFREIIPDAEVKLTLYNKTFTVLGDMNSGIFQIYKDKLTIYQALAMTGDLAYSGDHKHVRIIRPRKDSIEPEVLEFDIRTNTIINSKYYYVYPNDIIYVSRSKGSFYKVASYSGFIGLITSSLALLVSVLNYIPNI